MEHVDAKRKLIDVMRSFETVMVATSLRDGTVHARPMAIAEVDEHGVLWFATARDSPKVSEVQSNAHALVTAQSSSVFLSVSGKIAFVHDVARIAALWKPSWSVWFPTGKGDPSLTLMRLTPEIAEYWDNTSLEGVRHLFQVARSIVSGERSHPNGTEQHGKVSL